jgi:hypothetical protein
MPASNNTHNLSRSPPGKNIDNCVGVSKLLKHSAQVLGVSGAIVVAVVVTAAPSLTQIAFSPG